MDPLAQFLVVADAKMTAFECQTRYLSHSGDSELQRIRVLLWKVRAPSGSGGRVELLPEVEARSWTAKSTYGRRRVRARYENMRTDDGEAAVVKEGGEVTGEEENMQKGTRLSVGWEAGVAVLGALACDLRLLSGGFDKKADSVVDEQAALGGRDFGCGSLG
jgi:hypothetical protein